MDARLLTECVGTGAGLCSMASFLPQLAKLLRARRADGVSKRMYVVMVVGFSLWIAYGVRLGSWPIAASNAVNLILSTWILALDIRIERRRRQT